MLLKENTYAGHNPESCRYTVDLGEGNEAFLQYEMKDTFMHILYTEVPRHLRGQGKGKILMEASLAAIEKDGHLIVPLCSYVVAYLVRNPQWAFLVAPR